MRAFALAGAASCLVALVTACGPSEKAEGDCLDDLVAGDLVVTEVFADFAAPIGGTGADEGKEWFEIYNASDRPVELKGLTITHSRANGENAKSHVMEAVTIAPGQYFTLGNATPDLVPAYIDYGYSADLGDMFNSDGGKLTLSCGGAEVDSTLYEAVKSGRSRQLTGGTFPDYTLNDDLANWCEAADAEFESANFGTPGSDNDCTPVVIGQCNDGGTSREAVSPVAGDLIITEVMPNPAAVADGEGEWFEAKVLRDVDLNGVGLDRAGDSSNPNVITSADCIRVTAGTTALFAQNADTAMNGGLPAGEVRATFTFALVDGTAAAPGDVQIVVGTTVIDAISWTSTRSGRSHALDPDLVDPIANDMQTNFCDGATAYGLGDLGTPNADNEQCLILPPAGMCDDGGTIRAIVKPAVGQLVISEFLANPAPPPPPETTTDAVREWFEITNAGGTAFDVNELGLARTGQTANVIQAAACLSVPPGGFALFARSNNPAQNGMLPIVEATFAFSLVDTNGTLEVRDGTTILDAITWPSVASGISRQLDPDQLTTVGNDDPANFCPGVTPYGDLTNTGTPKAANAQCP